MRRWEKGRFTNSETIDREGGGGIWHYWAHEKISQRIRSGGHMPLIEIRKNHKQSGGESSSQGKEVLPSKETETLKRENNK